MAKKILIIDDDFDFLTSVKTVLQSSGYDPVTATSGDEGLKKAKQSKPDLIVLDVMMPGINGWDVCEALKEDAATQKIPVIMLTSVASHMKDSSYSHASGKQTEADDYIPKPVEPPVLLERVKRLVK
jgi:DNA-binding response OmpR family regulator